MQQVLSVIGSFMPDFGWLMWVLYSILGLTALYIFVKLGGNHFTTPLMKCAGGVLETRVGKIVGITTGVVILLVIAIWLMVAIVSSIITHGNVTVEWVHAQEKQIQYGHIYQTLSASQHGTNNEASGVVVSNAFGSITNKIGSFVHNNADSKTQKCVTSPFVLVANQTPAIATVHIDNKSNMRSMVVEVTSSDGKLFDDEPMIFRITEQAAEKNGTTLHWVPKRETLTLRGFADDALYMSSVYKVVNALASNCVIRP